MSRSIIITVVLGVVSLSVAALWMVFSRDAAPVGVSLAPAVDGADRRHRAEKFLGGDPDRDVRGGQETQPRW